MDKIMRMHSVTSSIENGLVYLPTEADWLWDYYKEIVAFPACEHDDQADSTSQALDWLKLNTHTYPLFEYYRQQDLRQRLRLPDDYRFVQCDEDEPIIAIQEGTVCTIIWTDLGWIDYNPQNR